MPQPVGVREGRVLGHLAHAHHAEAREHRGAGDVVDGNDPGHGGQPDHLPDARDVGGSQFLVRVDEIHRSARVIDDVDAPREPVEFAQGQAEAGRGEVTGQRHHAPAGQGGQLEPGGGVRDALQCVRSVTRPDQAPDPRVGGGQQFVQQVSPEEPGRSGEEYLQRPAPVRPPVLRVRAQPPRGAEFRLAGEVDPGLVALGGEPARAGLLGGLGELPQRRVAQQAAGERAHVVRVDPEHDPGVRQHLGGQQRVPPEGEEIVVEADLLLLQQLGPQVRQPGLRRRAPFRPAPPLRGDRGILERWFAGRVQRHPVQRHERGGNHVAGQPGAKIAPQAGRARRPSETRPSEPAPSRLV